MSGGDEAALLATICNTVGEASAYTLWFMRGGRQFVADLSGHMDRAAGLTGIAWYGGRLYVAVQSDEPRILVLDMALNLVGTIVHEGFNDLHALHVVGDTLLIVSARNGCVFQRNLTNGETSLLVQFDPNAWVCDVLAGPDDIWLCCHHLDRLDPAASGGGVYSARRRRVLLDGLSGPHTLMRYRDGYAVLDSAKAQLVFFRPDEPRRTVALRGFLRGAAVVGDDALLVAGGPDRTISRKNPQGDGARALHQVLDERLRIFDVRSGAVADVFLPECPGFEIYEMLALPAAAGFAPGARAIAAEPGLFARFYYTSLVTAHARADAVGS